MLNIISQSIYQYNPAGPKKVVHNLINGLKRISYPYTINRTPLCTDITLIHDDIAALAYLQKKYVSGKITNEDFLKKTLLIGPNIAFDPSELERHIPGIMNFESSILSQAIFICPSEWVEHFWRKRGFSGNIAMWPVGVDTYYFDPVLQKQAQKTLLPLEKDVLIYTKGRSEIDLTKTIDLIREQGLTYSILKYGDYTERQLINYALSHRLCLVIDSSESQGLALQELMALNIPLLIWDIGSANQQSALETPQTIEDPATSVPFFDQRCGIVVSHIEDIMPVLTNMIHGQNQFSPRTYISTNLSLEKQAQALVDLGHKKPPEVSGSIYCKLWRNRTWKLPWLTFKYLAKYLRWKLG